MQPIPGAPLLWAYETSNLSVRYYLAKDRPLKFFILAVCPPAAAFFRLLFF
jgi:hypothetical protein